MQEYKVRVDLTIEKANAYDKWRELAKVADDLFVVEEHAGKVHFHAYVKIRKSRESMAYWLKTNMKVKGTEYANEIYKPTKDGYFRYMCKGVNSGKDDDVIVVVDKMGRMVDQLHKEYHEVAEGYAANKKKHWLEAIADECKAKGLTSKDDVMRAIVQNRFVANKCFDEFMIVKFFWPVWMRVNACGEDDIVSRCMDRIRS